MLAAELEEVRTQLPKIYPKLMESYQRIVQGERDVYF